ARKPARRALSVPNCVNATHEDDYEWPEWRRSATVAACESSMSDMLSPNERGQATGRRVFTATIGRRYPPNASAEQHTIGPSARVAAMPLARVARRAGANVGVRGVQTTNDLAAEWFDVCTPENPLGVR